MSLMSSSFQALSLTRSARPLIESTVLRKISMNSDSGIPLAAMILMNCRFKNAPWYFAI